MKMKFLSTCLAMVLGAGAGYALDAFAQAKPEVLVKQRQSAMTLISKYFGPVNGMAQGKIPYNAEIVARNAGYLEVLAKMPWDGFAPATKDVKSKAAPAVFENPAKFKEAQERLEGAVGKLAAVAKSGDQGALKSAAGDVGKACGGCHDNFRQK